MVQFVVYLIALAVAVDASNTTTTTTPYNALGALEQSLSAKSSAAPVGTVDCNIALNGEYLWGVTTCKAPGFENQGSWDEYFTIGEEYGNDCVKIYNPKTNLTDQTCDAKLENFHGNYHHSVMCEKIGHGKCCQLGASHSENLKLDPSNPRVICSGGKGFLGEAKEEDFSDCDRLCCPDGCLAPASKTTIVESSSMFASSSISVSMSAVVFLVAAILCM